MSRSRFDRQDSALSTLALNAARSHRHVRLLREYVARRAFSVYKEYVDLHALTLLSGTKVTGTTLARDFREKTASSRMTVLAGFDLLCRRQCRGGIDAPATIVIRGRGRRISEHTKGRARSARKPKL